MGRIDEIIKERKRKIEELKKLGINPYPPKFTPKNFSVEIKKKYAKLKNNERTNDEVIVAGRVMSIRNLGNLIFSTLQDSQGKIQIILEKKETKKYFHLFKKYVDSADFIGVRGTIMKTKTGEISVLAKKMEILAKALLPLPEKWHGLRDIEERYRKRHLDLIMNPEVKEVFIKRSMALDYIREYLRKKGFLEVETPYLQPIYGGASAEPFETHLNALNMKLFLAISPELYLKRLIVGGFDRVFTISRNFRNEGIDKWHNPEFTMLEAYQAYADYNDMMRIFEDLYEYVFKKINKTTKVKFENKIIDFKKPWKRVRMVDIIKEYAGIDVEKATEEELLEFVKKNKIEVKEETWGWMVQGIFEHFCEKKIEQPTFILDHPLETTPLCKLNRKDKLCRLIERFEPFCMGAELGNAYSELNDPLLQRELFEKQRAALKKEGKDHPIDEDFLNAIETGMPPTGGFGLGVDRMVMFLTSQTSIRDVILFPFMKPKK